MNAGVITVNKLFTFTAARIYVEKGLSGFTIPTGLTLTLNNDTRVEGACGSLWRGIYVNGQLVTNHATIEDALFATRPFGNSRLNLFNTAFNKNFIGIFAGNGNFTNQLCMKNTFSGAGPVKGIGALSPLIQGILAPNFIGDALVQVIFNTGKGFAGIYLRDIGQFSLNISVLSVADQNLFSGLAVGIEAQNTSLLINRMARFSGIIQGAYTAHVSAGVRCWDDAGRNYRVIGNNGAATDYQSCAYGVMVLSQVPATGISISNNKMTSMQTGILLQSGTSGQYTGLEANNRLRGIYSNNITVDQNWGEGDASGSGILVLGNNPSTIGNLDVFDNDVMHDHNDNDPFSTTAAIHVVGPIGISGSKEVDVFRNRAVIRQGVPFIQTPGHLGVSGIYVEGGGRVRVRENTPEARPGAGVWIEGGPTVGIYNGSSVGNTISCNTVQSFVPQSFGFVSFLSPDVNLVSNTSIGGGVGAAFYLGGNSTKFRCNTLKNNAIGLTYRQSAQTGAQVSPTQTAGNCWDNTAVGVTRDATIMANQSLYYVRNGFPCETPPNSLDALGWFTNATTTNPPDCIVSCSAWASAEAPPAELSDMDALVAQDALQYPIYDTNRRWMNRAILYDKLLAHPALVSQNLSVQGFHSGYAGSSLAQLVAMQRNIGALNQYNAAQNTALNTLRTEKESLEESIVEKEAQFALNGNLSFLSEKAALCNTLLTKQAESAVLTGQLRTQALNEAAALVNTLTAIAPANTPRRQSKGRDARRPPIRLHGCAGSCFNAEYPSKYRDTVLF